MQNLTATSQALSLGFKQNHKFKIRKTETMFLKFLRKFFWLNKNNHGHFRNHAIDHLSDHLKRDIGLIEQDVNNRPRSNDHFSAKIPPSFLWL